MSLFGRSEGGLFVVRLAGREEALQTAAEASEEVALCGGVSVSDLATAS
jgi:hypothetical protein